MLDIRQEQKLEAEKKLKFQGTARVQLQWLCFLWNEPAEVNKANVERLKSIIAKDCRRLDTRNHIPAVISQNDLNNSISLSGLPSVDWLTNNPDNYPELVFPAGYRLECLHGRHRVEAAKEVLHVLDKWWTVDLYISNIDPSLRTCLIEEYSNELKPSSGEIYRKIRLYHFEGNLGLERRWKTWLSKHELKNMKRLLLRDEWTAAFDSLLDITGLWGGALLSTLHTAMDTKFDEAILNYLHHIKSVWYNLLQGNKDAMQKVDRATVTALQCRAPRASSIDAASLRSKITSGEIFGKFSNQERDLIWSRLQNVEGLIPSFDDFFANVHYLAALSDCMKWLTTLAVGETVWRAMQRIFSKPHDHALQTAAWTMANIADQINFGYRSLIVFAMRNHRSIPKKPSGKDVLAKPQSEANESVLREFAELASELGFNSPQIESMRKLHPTQRSVADDMTRPQPIMVTAGHGVPHAQRSGMPLNGAYNSDKAFMLLENLHSNTMDVGEGITTFFVRKHIYHIFFGDWNPTATVSTLSSNFEKQRQQNLRHENIQHDQNRAHSTGEEYLRLKQISQEVEQERLAARQEIDQERQKAAREIEQAKQNAETARQSVIGKIDKERREVKRAREEIKLEKDRTKQEVKRSRLELDEKAEALRAAERRIIKLESEIKRIQQENEHAQVRWELDRTTNRSEQQTEQQGLENQTEHDQRMQQQDALFDTETIGSDDELPANDKITEFPAAPEIIVTDSKGVLKSGNFSKSDRDPLTPIHTSNDRNTITFLQKDPSVVSKWSVLFQCTEADASRKTKDLMMAGMAIYNTELDPLTPDNCFRNVADNATFTVIALPSNNLVVDDSLKEAAKALHAEKHERQSPAKF